ncbi:hypothetical protein ACMFMG_001252 [Clarireedia jacksonii]
MSPPSSILERVRERERERALSREPSLRSPSMTSTLSCPSTTDLTLKSLQKAQSSSRQSEPDSRSRYVRKRVHRSSVSPSSASIRSRAQSHRTASPVHKPSVLRPSKFHEEFGDSSTLTSSGTASEAGSTCPSSCSSFFSKEAPPPPKKSNLGLEFLNFLDDVGIFLFCRPWIELVSSVNWVTLFDDVGVFYLCEPINKVMGGLKRWWGGKKEGVKKEGYYDERSEKSGGSERVRGEVEEEVELGAADWEEEAEQAEKVEATSQAGKVEAKPQAEAEAEVEAEAVMEPEPEPEVGAGAGAEAAVEAVETAEAWNEAVGAEVEAEAQAQ